MKRYGINVTVKSIKGHCVAGHKIGEVIEIRDHQVNKNICPSALVSMWPSVVALWFGGEFPEVRPGMKKDSVTISCPDPANLVIFELTRDKEIPHKMQS